MILYNFNKASEISDWQVVDDGVMGGLSNGHFRINDAGNGLYSGRVSLENNGGFSSLRYRFKQKEIAAYSKIQFRVKGDGKRYQFRVKTNGYNGHAYIQHFQTSGKWEIIEMKLADMYPTFRGLKLDLENYPGQLLEQIAFLIGNKTAESFQIEFDWIKLI